MQVKGTAECSIGEHSANNIDPHKATICHEMMSCYKYLLVLTHQSFIYESGHEIPNNVVCATSKASDQPAHMRSLIRAFARRLNIL